jgi:hypothetical protein
MPPNDVYRSFLLAEPEPIMRFPRFSLFSSSSPALLPSTSKSTRRDDLFQKHCRRHIAFTMKRSLVNLRCCVICGYSTILCESSNEQSICMECEECKEIIKEHTIICSRFELLRLFDFRDLFVFSKFLNSQVFHLFGSLTWLAHPLKRQNTTPVIHAH